MLPNQYWYPVKDGDPRVHALMKCHYSYQKYADGRRGNLSYRNRDLLVGPGEKCVYLTLDCLATWCWRKFIDDSGQTGVNNAFFRNEGPILSSLLILEAEQLAWTRWPGERLYTYVDANKVASPNPGYCFKLAGWKLVRNDENKPLLTGSGKLILEKLSMIQILPTESKNFFDDLVHDIGQNIWREITEKDYYYALEVLPPAFVGRNAFLMSEPYTHECGIPVYAGFVEIKGRYYARNVREDLFKGKVEELLHAQTT